MVVSLTPFTPLYNGMFSAELYNALNLSRPQIGPFFKMKLLEISIYFSTVTNSLVEYFIAL